MIPVLLFIWILTWPIANPPDLNVGRVAEPKVTAAMEYHGIRFADPLPSGKLIFMRDGQRCKLFTKSFEKDWEEKNK